MDEMMTAACEEIRKTGMISPMHSSLDHAEQQTMLASLDKHIGKVSETAANSAHSAKSLQAHGVVLTDVSMVEPYLNAMVLAMKEGEGCHARGVSHPRLKNPQTPRLTAKTVLAIAIR